MTNNPSLLRALIGCALIVALAACGSSPKREDEDHSLDQDPPALAAGQAYLYRHEGPTPFGDGRDDATGMRTVRVLGRDPEQNNWWVIEDRFENERGVHLSLINDAWLRYRQGLSGPEGIITIDEAPPVPVRFLDLGKHETKTYVYQQTFLSGDGQPLGAARVIEQVERRYDYRVITDAGAIICRSFHIRYSLLGDLGGEAVELEAEIETYWSDELTWFVQTDYAFEPLLRGGEEAGPAYEASSILVDVEWPESGLRLPPQQP